VGGADGEVEVALREAGSLVVGLPAAPAPDEQPARTATASRNAGLIARHEGPLQERGTIVISTSPIA
jgi:hypothetical protein